MYVNRLIIFIYVSIYLCQRQDVLCQLQRRLAPTCYLCIYVSIYLFSTTTYLIMLFCYNYSYIG